jgi:hypothetical protein
MIFCIDVDNTKASLLLTQSTQESISQWLWHKAIKIACLYKQAIKK